MDEHTLSDGGSDDAAVGTALLMADLEAAIASAGDEIAVLRSVADGIPRARTTLPDQTGGQPVAADPDVALPGSERVASVPEREIRDAAVHVAAPALPIEAARVANVALPDREPVVDGSSELPASVAARARLPMSWSPQSAGRVDAGLAGLTRPEAASQALPFVAGSVSPATALPAAAKREIAGTDWALPAAVGAAPATVAEGASTDVAAAPPTFEQAVSRAAAPVGTALAERPAPAPGGAGPDRDAGNMDRDRGESARGSHAGPTEGDVFLDGERVGRWMARHLARELGGPAASGTAFDPRVGPAWPGSLHGN